MRRLALVLLLLLLSAPTRAGVVDAPPPVVAIPGVPAAGLEAACASANRANLQAAIDKAGADGRGLVRFGPGIWTIDRQLFLDTGPSPFASVSLRGLDPGVSRIAMKRFTGYDAIALGIPRAPRLGAAPVQTFDGATFTPSPLDATAKGRSAFRTNGHARIAQMGGHLDQGPGDWYGATRQLTLDAAAIFHDAASLNDAAVLGLTGEDGNPRPIVWRQMNGRPCIGIATRGPDYPADPESIARTWWQLNVGQPFDVGVLHRLTAQFDLDAGRADFWIDGNRAVATMAFGTVPPPAGARFYPNQHSPFVVGGTVNAGGSAATRDVSLAGLKLVASALYVPTADAPTRGDGKPLTDALRYFADEPGWFAYLPLTADGATVAKDRVLAVRGRSAYASIVESGAYVTDPGHASDQCIYNAGAIDELGIDKGDEWYGRGIALGRAFTVRVRDCEVAGGAHGIGSFNLGGDWPLDVRDCTLRGHDAPLSLAWIASGTAARLNLQDPYRCGVRLVYSVLAIDGLFSPHWQGPEFGICARMSNVRAARVALDNEGGPGTQIADVYNTPMVTGQPLSAILDVDQLDTVTGAPGSSVILLGGSAATTAGYSGFRLRGVVNRSGRRAIVRVLPSAAGVWTDEGASLGSLAGQATSPAFEGPAPLAPKGVDTRPAAPTPAPAPTPTPNPSPAQ